MARVTNLVTERIGRTETGESRTAAGRDR